MVAEVQRAKAQRPALALVILRRQVTIVRDHLLLIPVAAFLHKVALALAQSPQAVLLVCQYVAVSARHLYRPHRALINALLVKWNLNTVINTTRAEQVDISALLEAMDVPSSKKRVVARTASMVTTKLVPAHVQPSPESPSENS